MKQILLPGLFLAAVGAGLTVRADSVGVASAPKPAASSSREKSAEDVLRVDFSESGRELSAYFQNTSQARLKVYSVVRFDPELARPRRYFFGELTSAAIIEPVVFDIDNPASISAFTGVLERFVDEAAKSGNLKKEMLARKVRLESTLSREETLLVEQQASSAASDVLAATRARITDLKREILLAGEMGEMEKISGKIGVAKINPDRPAYDFIASFEPGKGLYQLKAGYSLAVSERDAKFCLELLAKAKELKTRLLEHEAKRALLRREVDSFFSGKSE